MAGTCTRSGRATSCNVKPYTPLIAISRSTSSSIRSRVGTRALRRFIRLCCTFLVRAAGGGRICTRGLRLTSILGLVSHRLIGLTSGLRCSYGLDSDGGGTPRPERWGVDSEYGTLRDVLVGPIDHFSWRAGNAVAERAERVGLRFDFDVARAQYSEMLDVYAQAGVAVHKPAADPGLPYQLFARDSSVMTPWGAVIMQLQKPLSPRRICGLSAVLSGCRHPDLRHDYRRQRRGRRLHGAQTRRRGLRLLRPTLHRAGRAPAARLVRSGGVGTADLRLRFPLSASGRTDGPCWRKASR